MSEPAHDLTAGRRAVLTPADVAVVLIDYQTDLMLACRTQEQGTLRANAIAMAHLAAGFSLPVVMTGDDGGTPLGPIMPEVKAALPADHLHVQRRTVNGMLDDEFAAAVEATGRPTLVMAGITTDMCLASAAITATRAGYWVHVVLDASAAFSAAQEQAAVARMVQAGVVPRTWFELGAELAGSYEGPSGAVLSGLFGRHLPEYQSMLNNLRGLTEVPRADVHA